MHPIHTEKLSLSQRQAIWLEIFQAFEKCGLTQRAFCQQNQIRLDLFSYHWCKHIRKVKQSTPAFVPVELPAINGTHISIRWHDAEICVPPNANLCHVLQAIRIAGGA